MSHPIINIPLPPDFSFTECLWYLHRDFDDCLHEVNNHAIRKAIVLQDEKILIDITADPENLIITLLSGHYDAIMERLIIDYVEDWFDLKRDLNPFYALLNRDKKIGFMAHQFAGLRLIGIPDLFEAICWAIIGQQINLTFAYKTKRKLVERYGDFITYEDKKYYLFPNPKILEKGNPDELRAMQFSTQKTQYLLEVSSRFSSGELSKEIIQKISDFDGRQKFLTQVRGIGIWTANYALLKSLKDQSSVPYGDAGLLNALILHQIITDKKDKEGIDQFIGKYKNWESYLVFYLWRSLAIPKNPAI
ncbi:DNA-3-methyladenine glycosylase family protein [Flavobacterium sp. '19STA2R22 D10 B1']|uniref:DNA-3-methyladenine glycosylase family protein n=1 Tax=Flavobacterium aerium TaxID=3037261 RepID=UPI00278C78C9|nr:DNA glycosylase [Flavobacterium sp. '19STA2R22 D10 B1']